MDNETDTKYFDQEFTGESVRLTPPQSKSGTLSSISEDVEQPHFQQFSYHGSASTLNDAVSIGSGLNLGEPAGGHLSQPILPEQ